MSSRILFLCQLFIILPQNYLKRFGIHFLCNLLCIFLHLLRVWHDFVQAVDCFIDIHVWIQNLSRAYSCRSFVFLCTILSFKYQYHDIRPLLRATIQARLKIYSLRIHSGSVNFEGAVIIHGLTLGRLTNIFVVLISALISLLY
jgi:hypothetical protein